MNMEILVPLDLNMIEGKIAVRGTIYQHPLTDETYLKVEYKGIMYNAPLADFVKGFIEMVIECDKEMDRRALMTQEQLDDELGALSAAVGINL